MKLMAQNMTVLLAQISEKFFMEYKISQRLSQSPQKDIIEAKPVFKELTVRHRSIYHDLKLLVIKYY